MDPENDLDLPPGENDDLGMPPWISLPKEVRRRVVERMHATYPSEEEANQHRTELIELGMYRLVNHFQGNWKRAIKYARRHSVNPAVWPSFEVGYWQAAYQRTRDRINHLAADPAFRARAQKLFDVVREECARFYAQG